MPLIAVTGSSCRGAIGGADHYWGRAMTFDLVRAGCPNIVAVLALAVMPFVALAIPAGQSTQATLPACEDCETPGASLAALSEAE
jgi:hypothetical protein